MAKGGKGRRGVKGKKAISEGPVTNKKIEKKSTKKKERALFASTSTHSTPLPAPNIKSNGSAIAKQGQKKDKGDGEQFAGFIFMCSGRTKPECYKYRVFGLPVGRRDVVEKIKQGTKLFLFDFDLKLLYGVYKATSNGGYSLEPAAFGGRFPAQVKFKIFTDCLPLPEREFKHVIWENYQTGSKFTPELSSRQVKKLIAMFRPISLAPASALSPPPTVVPSQGRPLPVVEDRFQPTARLPPPEDLYVAQPVRLAPLEDPYAVPPARLLPVEDPYAMPPARLLPVEDPYAVPPARLPPIEDPYAVGIQHGRAPVALEPRHLEPIGLVSRRDRYYPVEARHAYLAENPPLPSQDPYGRYRESEYHRSLLEREKGIVPHLDRPDDYYKQLPGRASSHVPAPPYTPVSSHIPLEPALHQPSSYFTTIASEDPNWVYMDPHQRPASARISLAGGNLPVSSLYSFAGTTPAYR